MARYRDGYTFPLREPMYWEEAKAILRELGLSQVAAARKMGVHERTMSRWCKPRTLDPLPGPPALVLRYWREHPHLVPRG